MNAPTLAWPAASYFDQSSDFGRLVLSELEPVAIANWRKLYRHKVDGSHWALDEWDKYQEQFLVRVRDLNEWATEDHSAAEKALVLARRGGESAKLCLWKACLRNAVRGVAYCIDHLYAQGVRK